MRLTEKYEISPSGLAAGLFIATLVYLFTNNAMWAGFAFVFLFGGTFLLVSFAKAKGYSIASMLKTTRFNSVFEKFLFLGKLLDFIAESGLVLGYGIFGSDYLARGKFSRLKRTVIAVAVFALLYGIYFFTFGQQATGNGFIEINSFHAFMMNVSFAVAGFLGFSVYAMALAALDIITKISTSLPACPGIAPVIPGVDIPRVPISIPWFGWLSFLVIIMIHEGFHGILLKKEKMQVKSSGVLFLGLLPAGAFVEPDEDELKNAEERKRMKVFSAGPSSNLYSVVIFLLIAVVMGLALSPVTQDLQRQSKDLLLGVKITDVSEKIEFCNYSAESPNKDKIKAGDFVLAVNGNAVKDMNSFFFEYNRTADGNVYSSMVLTLKRTDGSTRQETIERDQKTGKIGVMLEEVYDTSNPETGNFLFMRGIVSGIFSFIGWTIVLSLLVGMFNYLPIAITDGAHMAPAIFAPYISRLGIKGKKADMIVSLGFLLLFILLIGLNALPYFFSA